MALIEAAYDKDVSVREVIGSSLFRLGQKHPALVLSSCNGYLFKQPKVCFILYLYRLILCKHDICCLFIRLSIILCLSKWLFIRNLWTFSPPARPTIVVSDWQNSDSVTLSGTLNTDVILKL